MVSAWYAVVFIIGMCVGAFYRVSEVVRLKKTVTDYKEAMTSEFKIPESWFEDLD